MDKDVKQQWITALRSGQYLQCQGELKDKEGANCCLGVLLETQGWELQEHEDYSEVWGDEFSLTRKQEVHLMNMNDKQDKDFMQIADWIEDHL